MRVSLFACYVRTYYIIDAFIFAISRADTRSATLRFHENRNFNTKLSSIDTLIR